MHLHKVKIVFMIPVMPVRSTCQILQQDDVIASIGPWKLMKSGDFGPRESNPGFRGRNSVVKPLRHGRITLIFVVD